MMIQNKKAPIKLNDAYCSRCGICASVCPFDVISLNSEGRELVIDIEKCQFCGLCAGVCPTSAIEIIYYDYESLIRYIGEQKEALEADDLVIMCRGSGPPSSKTMDVLSGGDVRQYVLLRLPCVGRVQAEFYLNAFALGIRKIVVIQCEADLCRFETGNSVQNRQIILLKELLEQLGYEKDRLTIIHSSLKSDYDTVKCVGCDKCAYICPNDAIEAQSLSTPRINLDKCVGCGVCSLVCPHLAIQLKGFEYEHVTRVTRSYITKVEDSKGESKHPTILVFCCQWAEFSALDDDLGSRVQKNRVIVEIPCFNALDPCYVVDALTLGYDGVLAIVCSEENCKNENGRGTAKRNMLALKRVLNNLNLSHRFELCLNSPRIVSDFDTKVNAFLDKISSMKIDQE